MGGVLALFLDHAVNNFADIARNMGGLGNFRKCGGGAGVALRFERTVTAECAKQSCRNLRVDLIDLQNLFGNEYISGAIRPVKLQRV